MHNIYDFISLSKEKEDTLFTKENKFVADISINKTNRTRKCDSYPSKECVVVCCL